VEAGNWKLVIENNRECYHCSAGHPELIVTPSAADFGYSVDELSEESRKEFEAHAQFCERKLASWDADGLIHAVVEEMDDDTPTMFRAQRLVIAGAGESQTMTTRIACAKLLGNGQRRDQGSTHLWTHSAWCHVMSDHAVITYCSPLTPDMTLVRTKWLVHADAVEGVDFDLSELVEVWTATNAADARFVGITQSGTQDTGYLPGPYSTYTEGYVERFAQWYTTRLKAHGI
jgi:Rieske 2Fe-2S family protein